MNSIIVIMVDSPTGNDVYQRELNVDMVSVDRRSIGKFLKDNSIFMRYSKVLISSGDVEVETLRRIIELLDEYDVVYVPSITGGVMSRLARRVQGVLMKIFMHEKFCGEVRPLALGLRSKAIRGGNIEIFYPYTLHSILIDVVEQARVKRLVCGESAIKTSFLKELRGIGGLIGIGRRTGELKRLIKFMLVGISGIVVNEGLLWLLWSIGLYYLIASLIAIETSIVSNFILNDMWTFRDRRVPGLWMTLRRLAKYNVVSWGTGMINWLVLLILSVFFGIDPLIANLVGIFVAFIGNFILSTLWAWGMKDSGGGLQTTLK